MSDDDVIEIGADGAFDIPSPEKPVPAMVAAKTTRKAAPVKPVGTTCLDILGLVGAGEYKVLSSEGSNDEFHLVINLEGSPNFSDVKVSSSDVVISFQNEKALKVNIADYNFDPNSVLATSWNHYLSFRFSKKIQ